MKKVDIITLGCSKNLVDSERLLHQFKLRGYEIQHDSDKITGDIVIVNTCGFIGDAKEESINMILELAELRESGAIEKLFVMGCLSERYLHNLEDEIPSVDKFYGKFNWNELLSDLGESYDNSVEHERILTTPNHYAYLKISEGCDRQCSYCAIPIITGKHKSRPIEELVKEVEHLVAQGVSEFQVIAQELTYYGVDLYKKKRLADLIDTLANIPGVKRLRLHYAYPSHFPMDLLKVIREHDNVCNYLDIALQHISDNQLKLMRRHVTKQETIDLIAAMRREVPGIHIRTTMLVGHPSETEEDFEELLDFVRESRFERLGAFAYSHEEGTYAAQHYEDNVLDEVKQERLDRLMDVQQGIAAELSEEKIGKQFSVIVDRIEGDYYVARTEFDSPEVDPEVLIKVDENKDLKIGHYYDVKIISADVFELYGQCINR